MEKCVCYVRGAGKKLGYWSVGKIVVNIYTTSFVYFQPLWNFFFALQKNYTSLLTAL